MKQTMDSYMRQLAILGRVGLSVLYPNDFEAYVISMELTTWDGQPIKFFTFPVNPVSFEQDEQSLVSVRKTFGGISTMFDKGLNTDDINITGNFGKKFKYIVNDQVTGFNSVLGYNQTSFSGEEPLEFPEFSKFIKSGYGSTKILQKLIADSYEQDKGKPRLLYLHNNAFGESFLIRIKNSKFSIRESRNLWEYNLAVEILAPADILTKNPEKDKRSLIKSLAIGNINNLINSYTFSVRRLIRNISKKDFETLFSIGSIDLSGLTDLFINFFNGDYLPVNRYLAGESDDIPVSSIARFEVLSSLLENMSEILSLNKNMFSGNSSWDMLELVETMQLAMDTVNKLPKYMRSAVVNGSYKTSSVKKNYAKGGSTFEDEATLLGFSDREDKAAEISLANMMDELSYEASENFTYSYSNLANKPASKGIISVAREDFYGNDIACKLTFSDDDLLVLDSDDTLGQTTGIIFNLARGDVPEFSEKGMPSDLFTNKNQVGHALSMVIRNWNSLFLQDDIYKGVALDAADISEDNLELSLAIKTKSGRILKKIIDVS